MKKKSKAEICDRICELEAYIEFLEDKLQYNSAPFQRKEDQNRLYEARKSLKLWQNKL